jgi:hypothetical protein
MADPAEKRLLARINDDLKWRSERFRLGRKTYEFVEMGALLANIRRRKGYRFKPALVLADPRDSDITDHGESSSEEAEEEDEEDENKDEDDEDKNEEDEDKDEEDEDKEEDEDETKSFTCVECDLRFSNSANLRRHRKSVHRLSKYSCSKCSRLFSRPDNQKRHAGVCRNKN